MVNKKNVTNVTNESSDLETGEVSEAVIVSITEEEMARWQREQGVHVVYHRGRYWEELRSGFYQPIHLLARLNTEQATRPAPLAWGFRAALCEDDAVAANGSVPVHLLSNLEGYDLQNFSSNRRHNIRRYHKRVDVVEVIDPALLQEQGYEVVLSATMRTGYSKAPSKEDYLASLKNYIAPKRRLILAGLIDGKLGGYISGYAVNGTAYFDSLYVATEVLKTNINSGLVYDFVQICRRCGVREIINGLHSREDSKLCVYKEGIGFPLKHIPTKVSINPMIGKFIRWQRPHVYYRLTGHD